MAYQTTTCRIRAGRLSDIPAVARLYMSSFDKEPLLDYMFPTRRSDESAFFTWIYRRFQSRYWDPTYALTVIVDDNDRPVAFSWWHRPVDSPTFSERSLSLHAWLSPLVRVYILVRNYLFPTRGCDPHKLDIYQRVFATVEPQVLSTPQRRQAWYLAILGVDPVLQGNGLGSLLLQDGLQRVDRRGVASWVVGLKGLERYYGRYGFVEVARANVGELKDWEGGSVMFRE